MPRRCETAWWLGWPSPAPAAVCAADIDLETAAWLWLGLTLAGGFAYALDPEQARELVPRMADTFVTMLRPIAEPQEI